MSDTPPACAMGARRPGLIGRVGRACYRHRWVTLLTWLAGVAILIAMWLLHGAPPQDNFTGSDPGQALLSKHFPGQSGDTLTLAIRSSAPVTHPPSAPGSPARWPRSRTRRT